MYGDGSSSRDYTFIDDAVRGIQGALRWVGQGDSGFDVFNLGNRRPVSLDELVSTVAEEMNATPLVERLPAQPGDVRTTCADITRACSELGYEPQTDFRTGVRAFLRWFEEMSRS